jgi:hypothetical protein
MSEDEQAAQGASFVAQSYAVRALPNDFLATLTRMDFQILKDGESSKARAGRDLCLGALLSAAIGAASLIATVDWETTFHQARLIPVLLTGFLFAIVAGSAVGAWVYHLQYRAVSQNSAHAMLMKRLAENFSGSGRDL